MTVATSDPLREGALTIVRTLRAAGFEALWAGGCVRDMVLGIPPKDYDIATSARPEAVMAAFDKTIPVGVQFGVVRVVLSGHQYEVATFRADGEYLDGRRPEGVRWSSAREDVLRRDFTINGLLFDPVAESIIDYVDGQRDIAGRLIRAIGEPRARFGEDHLRVLRALRFSARLGFAIEDDTWREVQAFAARVISVSIERIRDEIERLLTEGGADRGLSLLVDSGVGQAVLADLDLTIPARHFRGIGACDAATGWALLLAHVPAAEALARLDTFRLSNQFTRLVHEIVTTVAALRTYASLQDADKKRLLRKDGTPRALLVATAEGVDLSTAKTDLQRWPPELLSPPALITGRDLSEAGHRPGPGFREALEAVETAQLEGRIDSKDEALAIADAVLAGLRP